MAEKIIYNCTDCGAYFRSSDDIKYYSFFECKGCKFVSEKKSKYCVKCGKDMIFVSAPICPKCESKAIETRGSISVF